MTLALLMLATLVSEDLTCIAAGLLASRGELDLATALLGCYLGILAGDAGLFFVGRFARRTFKSRRGWPRRLPAWLAASPAGFARHGLALVLAARFLPGARLPIYLAAGALGAPPARFLTWAALAAVLWTPALVGLCAWGGEGVVGPLQRVLGHGWLAVAVAAVGLLLVQRALGALASAEGRARLARRVARVWRWEFWPMWLFYLPLAPWVGWLALRHGGLRTITAANPGFPHGGIVGESKADILAKLPAGWVAPFCRIDAGRPAERLAVLADLLEAGWRFPLILKPDQGERGAGVRLVRTRAAAEAWLAATAWPILVQRYHPGPFEAGIFYVRRPDEAFGRVFSITDKHFPSVVGNGRATLAQLVWRHPRYRMQAEVFLERLNGQARRVPAAGERVALAIAGNHCQGTLFRDGAHLCTPALERRIDEIARAAPGFCFGRFDVRYSDPAAFAAGRGFEVIELNGATSESTNVYDPEFSLVRAYVTLGRQWSLLFRIGAANRAAGARVSTCRELLTAIRRHYGRGVPLRSD